MTNIQTLSARRKTVADQILALGRDLEELDLAIQLELGPDVTAAFGKKGRDHGDCTIRRDGLAFKASIRRTVKWDSKALHKIAAQLPTGDAAVIFKAELTVPESEFEELIEAGHPIVGSLQLARTVKFSDLTIKPLDE